MHLEPYIFFARQKPNSLREKSVQGLFLVGEKGNKATHKKPQGKTPKHNTRSGITKRSSNGREGGKDLES